MISFLLLLLVSCKQNSTELKTDEGKINQQVLFHFSYDNYAWGHTYFGWYIDDMGNVWHLKETNHWWAEQMNTILSESKSLFYDSDSINQFYKTCRDTILAVINLDSLNFYYQLIDEASNGPYSEPKNVGADIGSIIYGCLYYNKRDNKYKKVILSCSGDWVVNNLDSCAIKIDKWLKRIYNLI